MLVLSRKKNERVRQMINGVPVWVTITEIRGDKVRLGFEAPTEVEILRGELIDRDPPASPETVPQPSAA